MLRTHAYLRRLAPVVIAGLLFGGLGGLVAGTGRVDLEQQGFQLALTMTFAVTWNLVGGLGGQHSFAQPAFFGVGAYVTGVILTHHGEASFAVLLISAALGAIGVALIISPCFRAAGIYFAILTVAVTEGLRVWADAYAPGRSEGIVTPISASMTSSKSMFIALALAFLALAMFRLIQTSRIGIGLRLIDADETAARSLGVPTLRLKVIALILSAPLVGALGCLFAVSQTVITPDSVFDLNFAVTAILVTILGGVGTFWGPVIGSVLWQLLTYYLQREISNSSYQLILHGGLLLIIIIVMPNGALGAFSRLRSSQTRRHNRSDAAGVTPTAQGATVL